MFQTADFIADYDCLFVGNETEIRGESVQGFHTKPLSTERYCLWGMIRSEEFQGSQHLKDGGGKFVLTVFERGDDIEYVPMTIMG